MILRRFHRWLGLTLALPLVVLAVTGILLNHTAALELNEHYAGAGWLLALYDINPNPPKTGYSVGEHWISHARQTLFLDSETLATHVDTLVGAVARGRLLIVATAQGLRLYMRDGRTVGQLPLPAEHGRIQGLALAGKQVLVKTDAGILATNAAVTQWQPYQKPWPGGVTAQPLPEPLRQAIRERLLATTLSWERVLRDLHSGRILGQFGPWLADAAAVVLIILALTGSIVWARSSFRRDRN